MSKDNKEQIRDWINRLRFEGTLLELMIASEMEAYISRFDRHETVAAEERPEPKEGYCELCELPMLPLETMFRYHGYSETCEQAKIRVAQEVKLK